MKHYKLIMISMITLFSLLVFLPNMSNNFNAIDTKLNLGLDLQGGSQITLECDVDQYLLTVYENLSLQLKSHFKQFDIKMKNLKVSKEDIRFKIYDVNSQTNLIQIIQKFDQNLVASEFDEDKIIIKYKDESIGALITKVLNQSIEIIRLRIDESGTKEPIIQIQNFNKIVVQFPGVDNPEELKKIIGQTAKLTFHIVNDSIPINDYKEDFNVEYKKIQSDSGDFILIHKKPSLNGESLIDASARFDNFGRPAVAFEFDSFGSKIFADLTSKLKGKRLAIVLDDKVLSAPVVNDKISGGKGIINGNFTVESANTLSVLLRAGALPAPLSIVEERSVGPTLGQDSINSGKIAGIFGMAGVFLFMFVTYGTFGLFANIALMFCIFYVLSALSLFSATLTLPGIAGIVLTIGMAVDANVLIYERIREELKTKTLNASVALGFKAASNTILDSNITTLIAAFMLYYFGVGTIKGFAVTLTIGILCSMFTSLILTRYLIELWISKRQNKIISI
jgi:preprotein translocase subunit SecD